MSIHGTCEEKFQPVKELFQEIHRSGREVGSSFSVYKDGIPLIDIWSGYTDKEKNKEWKRDTLANVWSTTKGITALTIAHAYEQGILDYEEKVSTYWPEFASNGKEEITVGMLLSHQAGICGSNTDKINDYYDQAIMAAELAQMEPLWNPGTASGYHSLTYGWLASELIIRLTGKTLGTYFRDEIAIPNEIDFYIGLPKSEEPRVAEMVPFPKQENQNKELDQNVAKKFSDKGPNLLKHQNSREWRQSEIASANGQGCASGIAKLYSLVVTEDLSKKILKNSTIQTMSEERIAGRDLVLGVVTRWGAGFVMNMHKIIYGPIEGSFGHSGWGGSCGFGDPVNNLGMSYVMNKMANNLAADGRSIELINKTYECLNGEN
tara:strand:- start:1932 stop:3062 length:1131 start_codon:yes stop_codon:yes gene_type:complete